MMDFKSKLSAVQTKLKAPKNLYNSFGGYKYRNCEGICEAVKPYLAEYGLVLLLTDHVEAVGDRIYVVAEAVLKDTETNDYTSVQAWAREPLSTKGQSEPQISGSSSSYARKYALNGLFLLDDQKDPDTDEHYIATHDKEEVDDNRKTQAVNDSKVTDLDVKALTTTLEKNGIPIEFVTKAYKVKSLNELTFKQFNALRKKDGIEKVKESYKKSCEAE